jgi:DNA-binding MarR family transcriptional regulator
VAHRISDWTFLTNHAHVLFCLAQDPGIRLRDVADRVGITERAVQRIVTELEIGAYITRQRNGRRNSYTVHKQQFLRHPIEDHCRVADLLGLIPSSDARYSEKPGPGSN